jgi:methionyl-tRNA formyltransferase
LATEGKRLFVGYSGGSIELIEIQLEGKKRMAAAAFLNGFSLVAGEVLR